MSLQEIQRITEALERHKVLIGWYSPHALRGSQKASLKRRGITFEQRRRANRWFELDFSK